MQMIVCSEGGKSRKKARRAGDVSLRSVDGAGARARVSEALVVWETFRKREIYLHEFQNDF